jgi:TonB family protein
MTKTELWKNWEGRVADEKFPLRKWLGGSDHSAVFQTERSGETSQKAAIKLIAAGANADRQLALWRAVAKLSHPHLLPIFNAGPCEIDGTPLLYVVMEFAEEDLSQILPQRALTPAETADMLPPILDVASYLHGQNYVHGAIKPSNLLAAGDQLKLSMDRAIPIGEATASTFTRNTYDAPETATGEISPAADVWAIGMTLVVALTQNLPAYSDAAQRDPLVPDSLPEPFRGIARECLRREVAKRCTIADIRAWRPPDSESTAAETKAKPLTEITERESSRWRTLIPVLAVLLVVALFFGWKFSRHDDASSQTAGQTEEPVTFTTVPTATAPQASTPSAPASSSSATPSSKETSTGSHAPATNDKPPAPQPAPIAPPKRTLPATTGGDVVRRVLPEVPRSASHTISGTIKVTVRVDVNSAGKVSSAKITHGGSSAYFNRLALQAAQRWEFAPPQVNGQPSNSAWNLRFQFKRSGTQAFSAKARGY